MDDIENGNGDLWKKEKYLTTNEIYELIPEERKGDDFHIKVSKEEAEFLVKNDFIDNIMNKEYGDDDDHWVGMTKDDLDEETNRFDDEYQTFEIFLHPATKEQIQTIFNGLESFEAKQELNNQIIGGKIKDIATEVIQNPESLKKYDQNTQNVINLYINQNPNIMENNFDQEKYLKDQLKYLGFGEGEKLHKDLADGINSAEKNFEIKTTTDKALPGNEVNFTLKFSKSEQGGVFFNSYDAALKNDKVDILQNFKVNKDNSFTAKEAINLLEGRAVKIEFNNPKTEQKETAFIKLDLAKEKNQYGNYDFQSFHQNYGVDTKEIVEKSNLVFDKPEYKDNVIKSLEKGNVVKVKFELDDKVIEGKAVLNPQYKNLNLYDNDMNRINTNKPIQGLENENGQQKSNVREQSISRGI